MLGAAVARAQLVECGLIEIDPTAVPGGCIARTLADQIGAGQGDAFTPGSSIYLISRDPARSIRRGRQLFQRKFTVAEGQGPRVNASSSGDINGNRALGAGLADSCAACHGRPRGAAGFGGDVVTRPDSRDSPHLFGLGLVEQLAEEMTDDLRAIRQQAIDQARANDDDLWDRRWNRDRDDDSDSDSDSDSVTLPLETKGVIFGSITAFEDGSVDTSQVKGVNADLRVRPFFHQGGTVSMREFIVGAMKAEMGMEAFDPVLCAVTDPDDPQSRTSPSGFFFDPDADTFERPPVCDATTDGDNDGVVDEIDAALIDHLEFYLLNYFKPGQYRTDAFTQSGRDAMASLGCFACHVPDLVIDSDRRVADVETNFDPVQGIFNQLFAVASTRFDVVDDGETYPKLVPQGQPFTVRNFFSDLKRHDLGPAFHERDFDGNTVTEFLTEPLWGVGTTGPYGHDGRSINLDTVIRRHGGEAESAKLGYLSLPMVDQLAVQAFLQTLVLFPPDDTASNLNPGDPGNPSGIQSPSVHGSINLGALFQIPEEGPE